MTDLVLTAKNLTVILSPAGQALRVIDGLDFRLDRGRTLGVVGESGCGKSMTALAVMGLTPAPSQIGGSLALNGQDLLALGPDARNALRGSRIGMIFQEPMTALNPVVRVGTQIAETMVVHQSMTEAAALAQAVRLLDQVGIADPAERARAYPHQLSGGMRQRVMIAMAIACRPDVLIADEPTTALDVSVQAQILDLLLDIQRDTGMAMLFISHNLGVISEMADDILVMYAGRAVEQGPAAQVLGAPAHPYTRALMATIPDIAHRVDELPVIPGSVPDLRHRPPGCAFAPRCSMVGPECTTIPALRSIATGHFAACPKT